MAPASSQYRLAGCVNLLTPGEDSQVTSLSNILTLSSKLLMNQT